MTTPAEKAKLELARIRAQQRGEGRTILALDPGTAATGLALLRDGEPWILTVVRARGATAEERLPAMCRDVAALMRRLLQEFVGIDTVAMEWQAIRPGDKRPNDILHLAMVLGGALASYANTTARLLTPLPAAWKGQTKPEIFDRRVREHYPTAAEKLHDVPEHLQHNAIDALGLASWAINRCLPWRSQ